MSDYIYVLIALFILLGINVILFIKSSSKLKQDIKDLEISRKNG